LPRKALSKNCSGNVAIFVQTREPALWAQKFDDIGTEGESFMNRFIDYFPSAYLTVNSIIYGVFAFLFVVDANTLFSDLKVLPREQVGLTELRAMYVGLMAAIGLFSILAVLFRQLQLAGIIFGFISSSTLAAARSYGMFIAGFSSELMQDLLIAEISSAFLALIALYCSIKGSNSIE
tara:strand:- start:638 stop:1171 length:534 start_codon:yes stop_codon:yes gene_type:complete